MSVKISEEKLSKIGEIITENAKIQRQNMSDENKMFSIYLHDPTMQPRVCAEKFNMKYGVRCDGTTLTGDGVIRSFKITRMGNRKEREAMFKECVEAASLICKSLAENSSEYIDDIKKRSVGHTQKKRIILLSMFEMNEQLRTHKCREELLRLNRSFSEDCIDAILMMLAADKNTKKRKISPQEYENEIVRLDAALSRSNKMIERLQNEFNEEIEEYKLQARADLITQFNSRDYGYILDMLQLANKGFRKLRREGFNLPVDINMLPVLMRNLTRFVEDCGIEQIAEIGEEFEITINETEEYEYEGSAFADKNERKTVRIISCGWKITDENIIISKPKVKETEE